MGKRKRFIDLSGLPRNNKNNIDWKNSIGYKVYFEYEDIKGYIEILDYYYISNKAKINIKYKNNEFKISTYGFKKCELGKFLGKISTDFKYEIGERLINENRDITIIDRKIDKDSSGYNRRYYKYKCNKCGFDCGKYLNIREKVYKEELWIREDELDKGNSCSCCSNKIIVEGINDISTTDPWMISYIGLKESKTHTHSSGDKIYPICPHCGRIKKNKMYIYTIYKTHSIGCICGDGKSKISKYMFNLLEQLKEQKQINDFEIEKIYKWNNYFKFDGSNHQASIDFVIHYNNKEIPIETDGNFHRENNKMNGQSKEESQYIDKQRDDNCLKYLKEKTIRISDEGDIKQNILNSQLNKMFDLSIVNWDKCEEYSLSNLVKIACKYKKENPELTTTQIGNIMGYNYVSIIKWLKQGKKLGWCDYNPHEEMRKNGAKNNKSWYSKPIEIFKNNKSIGIFPSALELQRKSEGLFGIKLHNSSISNACRNNKPYKGYTFKYISREEYERRISEVPTLKESE